MDQTSVLDVVAVSTVYARVRDTRLTAHPPSHRGHRVKLGASARVCCYALRGYTFVHRKKK